MLHILLIVLALLLPKLAELANVLVLLSQLTMSTDDGIGDLKREINHSVDR